MTLTTERLRMYPATQSQMEDMIASETDGGLRAAYSEMLEGGLKHPGQWEWFALWMIELHGGTLVGGLCFKGLNPDGSAEIGYGISDGHQGKGYATEAVKGACAWAFQNPAVTRIEAESDPDNAASVRVLMKCGFASDGRAGSEGLRFVLDRGNVKG